MTSTHRTRPRGRTAGCVPAVRRQLNSFEAIVADYRRECRRRARAELEWFRSQPSLAHAVELAGLAQGRDGTKCRHQFRIPRAVLRRAASHLARRIAEMEYCRDFHAPVRLVEETIGPVRGVGKLTAYDTALRIGAKLELAPFLVYLHSGTRAGARALGFNGGRRSVGPRELPRAFRALEPHEIEDCLCIYKAEPRRVAGGAGHQRSWRGSGKGT